MGGNHFRYWQQNGQAAPSNAIFMACVSFQLFLDSLTEPPL